jgi:O-antigen/teichoic acid export membrane protein
MRRRLVGSIQRNKEARPAALFFLLRVTSAGLTYILQILLAQWMGKSDYGVYVYAWTWVVIGGSLADIGLATTVQRFIPQYLEKGSSSLLSGFLVFTRILPILTGCVIALTIFTLLNAFRNHLDAYNFLPLCFACLCIPLYATINVQEGIARAFGRMVMGSVPDFILRPVLLIVAFPVLLLFGLKVNGPMAMLVTLAVVTIVAAVQVINVNFLTRPNESRERNYEFLVWTSISIPVFLFVAFHSILSSIDIVILEYFRPASEVGSYYAASKTMMFASFVTYSVSAISARRFSELWVTADQERMDAFLAKSVSWTFWPSVFAVIAILIVGKPLLMLFGSGFADSYNLMFIVAVGIVAQSMTGPAEALLNMVGLERACAKIYALCLAVNVLGCIMLVPQFGAAGAAASVAGTLAIKSVLVYYTIKSRLSLHAFIWRFGALSWGTPGPR